MSFYSRHVFSQPHAHAFRQAISLLLFASLCQARNNGSHKTTKLTLGLKAKRATQLEDPDNNGHVPLHKHKEGCHLASKKFASIFICYVFVNEH